MFGRKKTKRSLKEMQSRNITQLKRDAKDG